MLGGPVPRERALSCHVIGRSTTDWHARYVGNWLCRRRQAHDESAAASLGSGVSSEALSVQLADTLPGGGMFRESSRVPRTGLKTGRAIGASGNESDAVYFEATAAS
jgi:hypothetical protein